MSEIVIIAEQSEGRVQFSDGAKRSENRVLADGAVQSGTSCFDESLRAWQAPQKWTNWTAKEIVQASKSRNGMSQHQWFCRLPANVRDIIRTRYGLVATGRFPCAGKKDGCGKVVGRLGEYCPICQHDAI